MKVAFFHTLASNIEKFELLAQKYAPEAEVHHFVNNDILPYALRNGKTDDLTFDREIETIRSQHPDLIICTCSTYGEASDRHSDVKRIDQPIADYIVKTYQHIGLAFAATSTRDMSYRLLSNAAKSIQKTVAISDIDCSSAWPYFQQGDHKTYVQQIAQVIKEKADKVEVIFLAQASMEDSKTYLNDLNIEVMASPAFGVKALLKCTL